ncbi:MAG: hypothetical protein AAF587_22350 [Bacteroidota bacterium]
MQIATTTLNPHAISRFRSIRQSFAELDPRLSDLVANMDKIVELLESNRLKLAGDQIKELMVSTQQMAGISLGLSDLVPLFDLVFCDILVNLIPLSEVFSDACSFALAIQDRFDFMVLDQISDRPIPVDVSKTMDRLNQLIHHYQLSSPQRGEGWGLIDQAGRCAIVPTPADLERQVARTDLLAKLGTTFSQMEGDTLSRSQLNELFGTILLSKPSICPIPELAPIFQIMILLGGKKPKMFFEHPIEFTLPGNFTLVSILENLIRNKKTQVKDLDRNAKRLDALTALELEMVKATLDKVLKDMKILKAFEKAKKNPDYIKASIRRVFNIPPLSMTTVPK